MVSVRDSPVGTLGGPVVACYHLEQEFWFIWQEKGLAMPFNLHLLAATSSKAHTHVGLRFKTTYSYQKVLVYFRWLTNAVKRGYSYLVIHSLPMELFSIKDMKASIAQVVSCCVYDKPFFLNGPILASFSVYFRLFNTLQFKFFKLKKSVDGVLGIRTRGGRMEGANESTELRRHPNMTNPLSKHVWLLGQSCCSSPSTKKLHCCTYLSHTHTRNSFKIFAYQCPTWQSDQRWDPLRYAPTNFDKKNHSMIHSGESL